MNQVLERIASTSGIDKVLEFIVKALCFVLLSTAILVILVLNVTSSKSPSPVGCFHETQVLECVHVCTHVHARVRWAVLGSEDFLLILSISHASPEFSELLSSAAVPKAMGREGKGHNGLNSPEICMWT